MEKKSLVHALYFDKNGGAKNVEFGEAKKLLNQNELVWLHLDYEMEATLDYLNELGLDDIVIDALLSEQTRPRITKLDDNLLMALRGVNLNANSNPEDMVSIRLFVGQNIIVSTKKRDLLSVKDMVDSLLSGNGVKTSAEFLIELTYLLTSRMQDTIIDLDEEVGILEENILDEKSKNIRTDILTLRKEALILKRYISPQRDALNKLSNEKIIWIDEYQKLQLKEITDNLYRYVEELDTLKDRISFVQEELSNVLSEKMNSKMYILSIISAIFLPLGFLTGLLGINVGGIPGAENQNSFGIFIGILIVLVGIQLYYFKKKNWI